MGKPLEGVRVLDLTQAYSGPFCTMNLADHGAEVIKIERPGNGDQSRFWGPFKDGYSGYFAYLNRNKKGITLDLAAEEGKQIFKRLLKTADVVCENYKVGVMQKLGFDYDTMKTINPRIIYASISGFGLEGPLANRTCYDIVAQAMSGMMSVTGFKDGPPCKTGPSIGDSCSGAYMCMGILMALYQREKTGEGRRLDVAMTDSLFSLMENFVVDYTINGTTPVRAGNQDPSIAPFDSFEAKDGSFVMGCGTDRMFHSLAHAMGMPDLSENPLYKTNVLRHVNYETLKPVLESWFKTKTVSEIEKILVGFGIPFGNILTIPQATEHEQLRSRNMLWNVEQPGMDSALEVPSNPIKLHGTEDRCKKPSPQLGEDNGEVLSALGFSKKDIQRFADHGVI